MVLNYIGSKKSLASRLVQKIKEEWPDISGWNFCDAFAGTGALSVAIAPHVQKIMVNDWEDFCVALLHAQFNPPPNTLSLVTTLNSAPPETGLITNTYSELGGRLYFSTLNGQRIDGIRHALRAPNYTSQERNYLRGALVSSADSVANVASVYGAYLKNFKVSATSLLKLNQIPPSTKFGEIYQMDAQEFCLNPTIIVPNSILYIDPPYNQRQYGANYFPLNAIADIFANSLEVSGVTGIPVNGYKKSDWCSQKKAYDALKKIVMNTPAKRIVLSYNNEGMLSHHQINDLFVKNSWSIKRIEIAYKRFASQKDLEPNTTEFLFVASKIFPSN